ncbi:MAG: hypothetical protein IPO27_02925 [Bacteroidetes bacterium]|nr:hypothetical protein [Bacteroidota bacterium]
MKRVINITAALLTITMYVAGQKTGNDLGDETIVIDKGYKPQLADGLKISDSPKNDTAVSIAPKLTYEISNIQSETNFQITPLKPVRVKEDNIKELYRGFIKAQYGYPGFTQGDFAYNALRSKEFDAGIHIGHLAGKGSIKGYGFPGFSNNVIDATAAKFMEQADFRSNIGYVRDLYHYYGYDGEQTIYSKKETRHIFNTFFANAVYKARPDDSESLDYTARIDYYNTRDNLNANENNFGINGEIAKPIGKGKVGGEIALLYNKIDQVITTYSTTLVSVKPRYSIKLRPYNIDAGVDLIFRSEDSATKVSFFPALNFAYTLVEGKLSAFGELNQRVKMNTFRLTGAENPFLDAANLYRFTYTPFHGKIGVSAKLDRNIQFRSYVDYSRNLGSLFFVNMPVEPVKYSITYRDNQVVNVYGSLLYEQSEKWNAGVFIDYYSFIMDQEGVEPTYTPTVRTGIKAGYNMQQKIVANLELFLNNKAFYYDYEQNQYAKLKGWVDVNLNVQYRYNKLLSFSVTLDNLGFSKFQRFYKYPVYPFSAMAGLSYSF